MSRTEFMEELRKLLWGLSVEEQKEALQYYEDYFDDAGPENEASVIKELESPSKVAAVIRAGLAGEDDDSGEYRETGYRDVRFEDTQAPATREELRQAQQEREEAKKKEREAERTSAKSPETNEGQWDGTKYHYQDSGKNRGTYTGTDKDTGSQWTGNDYSYGDQNRAQPVSSGKPWSSNALKILLIVAILLVGIPTVVPLAGSLLAAVFAILLVAAVLLAILPLLGIVAVVTGIALVIAGIKAAVHAALAEALILVGAGFFAIAFGIAFTTVCIWVCARLIPPMFRWFVALCKKGMQKIKGVLA